MEKLFTLARDLARFRKTALGKYLDGFANWLRNEGYRPRTIRYRVRLAASFGEWLESSAISVESINQQHTIQFFSERKQRPMHHDVPALNQLLELLRDSGTIGRVTIVVPKMTAAEKLAEDFAVYLSQERGLSEGTTDNKTRFVKGFLRDRFPAGEASLSIIRIEDVIGFVPRQAANSKPAQSKQLASALCAFLRYALYQGYIGIDLAVAVPTVANWSKESIPKSLSHDQVERILSCCVRQTAIGKRDYAILMLLSRLGLRGGALVSLRLEDIDWHSGCIIVRGKGSSSQLPLPSDAGEAIASYLHYGRP